MEARRNRVEWSMWVSQCHQLCIISLQCVYHIDHIVPSAYSSRPNPMEVSFQAASNFQLPTLHRRDSSKAWSLTAWLQTLRHSLEFSIPKNTNKTETHWLPILIVNNVNVSLMDTPEGPLGQDHWIQTWLLRLAGIPTFWTFPTHSQGAALPW